MARIDSSIGIRCRRYRTHGCENTKGVRKMGMFCTTCAPKYADRKHWEALEYHRQRQRAYQDYKKTRSDQCRRCNKKPMPGSPLCMRHYKEHAEAQPATMRRKRKQLRKEGLKCTTCRHLLPTGWKTHTCRGCIVRNRLWRHTEYGSRQMSESYARYKLRKDGLPHPCMSILEQLDFKHEFLQDRLASIPLPHTGALYMDSEVIDIKLGHEASNTYEWSAARFVDGKPHWYNLQAADVTKAISSSEVQLFAKEVNSWIAGSQVVMYGRSRPEYHRIAALQGQLPASVPASTYSFYEPMNAFMDKIFTRNPKEEMDPNGRVYIPTFALTYLLKRLEKIEKQEYAAFRPLTIPPLEVARGKSAMDTVYLYNLMDAIRQARNGRYFRPDLYGPEATAQPEQKIPHPSVKYPKRGQGLRKFLLEKSRPAVPVPSHSNALPLEVPLTEAQIEQMESNEKMKKHYAPLTNQLFNRSPIEYAKKKQDLQAQVKVVVVKVAVTPSAASSSFFVPRKRKHAA